MTIRFLKAGAIPLLAAVAITAAGCGGMGPQKSPAGETPVSPIVDVKPPVASMAITVFYPDWQVQHMIPELRQVPEAAGAELATRVVEELLAGPADPHLLRPFPDGVRLLEPVSVANGVATVNLSEEAHQLQGSASIVAALNALRLSMREIAGIERVQLQVNGRSEGDLGGMVMETMDFALYLYPVLPNPERTKYLQGRVEQGLDPWRRDPLKAAQFEGRMFGFTTAELEKATIKQDGNEADAYVTRDGTTYSFTLVRNQAAGEGGVWTIESLSPMEWHEYDSLPLAVRKWADLYTSTTIGATRVESDRLYLLASVEEGEVRITSAGAGADGLVVSLAEEGGERVSIASVPAADAADPVVFQWTEPPAGAASQHTSPDALPVLANPHQVPEAKLTGDAVIVMPAAGQQVSGTITVKGFARHLFEASISARLLTPDGQEVAVAHTMAAASAWDWGSYEMVLEPSAPAGDYRLSVGTYSPKDGFWESLATVEVTVK